MERKSIMMRYPVVIHKDVESAYGVTVPDLPGCFSAGDTFDEALEQAKEAILCHVEGLLDDGIAVPSPQTVDVHQRKRLYTGGVWAVVEVDPSALDTTIERVNITLPRRVLTKLDAAAKQVGETRSGMIARLAMAGL
jgi:predicted RNase H-like HicB family nuclease